MKRYYQNQPFSVADFKAIEWKHPVHRHNHYELIYIKSGKGTHFINGVGNDYKRGSIYLLGPDDEHYFQIVSLTHFVYLKFTDLYVHKDSSAGNTYLRKLEYLLKSRETHLAGYKLVDEDLLTADQIFDVMISMKDNIAHNEDLLLLQLLSMAIILLRNMPELKTGENRSRDMQALFCYLHKYIYDPGKLKAAIIAKEFNTTAGYIGPYFKRNTGLTLRNYIHDYRKVLIGRRIDSGQHACARANRVLIIQKISNGTE